MSKRIQKINQLDSLRAFAALCVVLYHFLPDYGLGVIKYGWIGVDVFFVVSGYLITAILLEQKSAVTNKLLIIKNFVIKRALRLFPAYYFFITFFWLLMVFAGLYVWDTGDGLFFYTYTQNILFFMEDMKGAQTNHLWTLAVEEQFYLIWPWLMIYISNGRLIQALLFIIPATLLFKSFADIDNLRMLATSHFDTLGTGALVALLLKEKGSDFLQAVNNIKNSLLLAALALFVLATLVPAMATVEFTATLLLSTTLLIGCYYQFTGVAGHILNLEKLQYLGKISYGLYLYHKPIPYFIRLLESKNILHVNSYLLFVFSLAATILIAHGSYVLLERPFLKLKDRFDL